MKILESLNEEQQEALLSINGANLVSAGAGTGKTRLLTHRIAYLIQELNVSPYNILAITFTNKAANEMKSRVESLVDGGNRVWISTFHSMCVRILRADIEKLNLNYDRNFTIYSESDSEKVIKSILKDFGIEDEHKKYAFHISNCKNKNLDILAYKKEFEYMREIDDAVRVFNEYEMRLKESNALDFDDLLLKTYQLFVSCPDVLEFYSRRFEYVLVDEFQDTNKIQYDLTKMLCLVHKNLFVVGDEDQSIYSWRGADFSNIFNISKDFENTHVFKLQQNYRCTKDILQKANTLIALNEDRFEKKLWTNKQSNEKVVYKTYYDEQEEASSVAATIHALTSKHDYKFSDIAILVRLNALTLPFEEKLLAYNIPHKIYGGFKFFERLEIKNILSYLRIFINPKDEVSLLRIINFPKRGIGDGGISLLKNLAEKNNMSILEVILKLQNFPEAKKLESKLANFKEVYNNLLIDFNNLSLDDFVVKIIDDFKVRDAFLKDSEEETDKLMNIDQFENSIKMFVSNNPGCTLSDYLESVTLQSDIDTMGAYDNVTVATVHAVKGLEFKVVFVVGMEEGIFPLSRCQENPKDLQEERRLAYVAFTRAEERLFVSSCSTRYLYGKRNYQRESRFVSEAGLKQKPKRLFDFGESKNVNSYSQNPFVNKTSIGGFNTKTNSFGTSFIPKPTNFSNSTTLEQKVVDVSIYKTNQIVGHPKFGVGTIVSVSGDVKTADIDFGALGKKTLMLEIAPLKIIKN